MSLTVPSGFLLNILCLEVTLYIHKLFDDILGVSLSTLSATKVLPVKRTWRSQILMSLVVSEEREMLHSCATHRDAKPALDAEKVETF